MLSHHGHKHVGHAVRSFRLVTIHTSCCRSDRHQEHNILYKIISVVFWDIDLKFGIVITGSNDFGRRDTNLI